MFCSLMHCLVALSKHNLSSRFILKLLNQNLPLQMLLAGTAGTAESCGHRNYAACLKLVTEHLWDKMHLCSSIKQSSHHKSFRGSKRRLCRRAPGRATAHQPSPAKSVIMCLESLLFAKIKITYWSRVKQLRKILCEDLWLKLVWPPISVVATQDPTACADHRKEKSWRLKQKLTIFKFWTRSSRGDCKKNEKTLIVNLQGSNLKKIKI